MKRDWERNYYGEVENPKDWSKAAKIALISLQAKIMPNQMGYWEDLISWSQSGKGVDIEYKIERIASTQTPEIAAKLKALLPLQ